MHACMHDRVRTGAFYGSGDGYFLFLQEKIQKEIIIIIGEREIERERERLGGGEGGSDNYHALCVHTR